MSQPAHSSPISDGHNTPPPVSAIASGEQHTCTAPRESYSASGLKSGLEIVPAIRYQGTVQRFRCRAAQRRKVRRPSIHPSSFAVRHSPPAGFATAARKSTRLAPSTRNSVTQESKSTCHPIHQRTTHRSKETCGAKLLCCKTLGSAAVVAACSARESQARKQRSPGRRKENAPSQTTHPLAFALVVRAPTKFLLSSQTQRGWTVTIPQTSTNQRKSLPHARPHSPRHSTPSLAFGLRPT